MVVSIVRKFAPGTQPARERALRLDELEALIDYFLEADATLEQAEKAQSIRQKVYDEKMWLACDCTPDFAPLYFQLHGGRHLLHFGREGRPPHTEICPFGEKQRLQIAERRKKTHIPWSSAQTASEILWNVHSQVDDKASKTSKREGPVPHYESSDRRVPRMGRMLFELLHSAKINLIDEHFMRFQEAESLSKAAQAFQLANKRPVSEFLGTSSSELFGLCQKLRNSEPKSSPDHWPRPSCPQGFLLLPTLAIKTSASEGLGNDLILREKRSTTARSNPEIPYAEYKNLPLKGRVRIIGPCRQGPFFTLVSVARERGDWRYDPWLACAVPTVSPFIMLPVESNYEREVAKILIKLVTPGWQAGQQTPPKIPGLELFKPLLDDPAWSVRPDFVLTEKTTLRKVVIEVLGYEDDEYRNAKMQFIDDMTAQGKTILVFDAYQADITRSWSKRLRELEIQVTEFFKRPKFKA